VHKLASSLLARFFSTILIILAIFVGSRALIRALPGDPVDTLIAESGTSIPRAVLLKELGLDRPFFEATAQELRSALHGDLGVSLLNKQPVLPLVKARFLNTLALTACAFFFALIFSLSLGLNAAQKPGGIADSLCSLFGALSASLPTPWLGPMLIILFAFWIPIFQLGDSLLLPALTLALSISGFWSRLVRERVRETLRHGSAQAARARGLGEFKVVVKYGLAPASGLLAAYFGSQFGALLSGAFVTEVIFNWKGMGNLLVNSVLRRDYPVIEAAICVGAICSVSGTAIGDWIRSSIERREEHQL